jgi:predicted metalloendopeptidase
LRPLLNRIAALTTKEALATELGSQLRADVDPLNATNFNTDHVLGFWAEQDLNDPSRVTPYLLQGGLGMPDRSYYLDASPKVQEQRAKYKTHLVAMLRLAGLADAEAKAARIYALEEQLARSQASLEDSEDIQKTNNPWERADFDTRAPGLDWKAFFTAAGLEGQQHFIVWQPTAVTGLAALVRSEPLSTWQEYLTARALDHAAPLLPKPFVDENFAFYGTVIHGTPQNLERWKRGVAVVNDELGEALGKLYVARWFPPESKAELQGIIDRLVTAFGKRIDALAWMAPETKAKAREKLKTLKVGVGYPDHWRDYSGLEIVRGDALGNMERAELFEYRRNLARLGRPADRDEWAMLPQTVNAVNLPVRNSLNFPAGYLEPPYYDRHATAAVKYGSIGATIGHEISHSFDDQGSQFDALGRLANWWTPADLQHFQATSTKLAEQFSAYHPFPDASVNGKQTLSENIADLAGLAAAYDAWRSSPGADSEPPLDGFTAEQQFFLSYAQSWQEKVREAAERSQLLTDGHAPAHYRALTVRNMDTWYNAFAIPPNAPLYLAPADRVRVW